MRSSAEDSETLLCVANFPKDTGFAWSFIRSLYGDVAERLGRDGIRTLVAFPAIAPDADSAPDAVAAEIELEIDFGSVRSVLELISVVLRRNVTVLYLTDRDSWHPVYLLLRVAGVERIVVHDHTSGRRARPRGVKRILKWCVARIPGITADRVVGVSDFVARRKVEVDLVPPERVQRIWNAVPIPDLNVDYERRAREKVRMPEGRPVVAAASRSAPEKGIQHLLRAFDQVCTRIVDAKVQPVLLYLGSGPALDELREVRSRMSHSEKIVFAGYREDAAEIVAGADIAVVPSVWEEAFGLSALEPMAHGIPVIASSVGGLPEVVSHDETGLLVPPGDEEALAEALERLLVNERERQRMGRKGRVRAERLFSWPRFIDEVETVLRDGFYQ